MKLNNRFKMRVALVVFLVLSISLTGNNGKFPTFAMKPDVKEARVELDFIQQKSSVLLFEIEQKLDEYELTTKDME